MGSLAAELHAVVLIDIDDEDFHLVTHAANIPDRVDVASGELADVNKTVAAGQNFDECTEILDARDTPVVDLADLHRGGAGCDGRAQPKCR